MGDIKEEKKPKIDTLFYGILIGVILPIIGFFVSYYVKKSPGVDFARYVDMAFVKNEQQKDILIFCLLPNLFMFYFSNFRFGWYNFTKGLVSMTVIAVLALVFLTY
jgi:hypothetical protein